MFVRQLRTPQLRKYLHLNSYRNLASAAATSKKEHDFVIVGAGSAGCILTHRLSAAGNDICLLEAGPSDQDEIIQSVTKWADLFYHKTYNWNYWLEPQQHSDGRRLYWPRGKALGGTSSVNSAVLMRPNPLDMDRWAFKENAYGWSHANTLPYFKRLETYHPNHDYPKDQLRAYRGFDGPMQVTSGALVSEQYPTHSLHQAFIEAGCQYGLQYNHDANGYRQEGVFWADITANGDTRFSTSNTYLKLARKSNAERVHVHVNSHCTKLLFNDSLNRVIGVEVADTQDPSKVTRYYARKDVILSGGSINSPQLLQLSGIGNADDLKTLGIQPVVNLPGVGFNLQDHVRFVIIDECKPESQKVNEKATVKCQNNRSGMVFASAHIRLSEEFDHPNVQVHFGDGLYNDVPNVKLEQLPTPVSVMTAFTQRAFSRGHVKLASANPFDHPTIDPQLFSDPRDIVELVRAFKFCRPIFGQRAFEPFRKGELFPGPNVQADKEIEQFIRSSCFTAYHPCGTCKLGDILKDPMAVVDPHTMRVHGIDGLRVVDASVMPSEPSCNVNAPTMMIAERASDLILEKQLMPPENTPFYRVSRQE